MSHTHFFGNEPQNMPVGDLPVTESNNQGESPGVNSSCLTKVEGLLPVVNLNEHIPDDPLSRIEIREPYVYGNEVVRPVTWGPMPVMEMVKYPYNSVLPDGITNKPTEFPHEIPNSVYMVDTIPNQGSVFQTARPLSMTEVASGSNEVSSVGHVEPSLNQFGQWKPSGAYSIEIQPYGQVPGENYDVHYDSGKSERGEMKSPVPFPNQGPQLGNQSKPVLGRWIGTPLTVTLPVSEVTHRRIVPKSETGVTKTEIPGESNSLLNPSNSFVRSPTVELSMLELPMTDCPESDNTDSKKSFPFYY